MRLQPLKSRLLVHLDISGSRSPKTSLRCSAPSTARGAWGCWVGRRVLGRESMGPGPPGCSAPPPATGGETHTARIDIGIFAFAFTCTRSAPRLGGPAGPGPGIGLVLHSRHAPMANRTYMNSDGFIPACVRCLEWPEGGGELTVWQKPRRRGGEGPAPPARVAAAKAMKAKMAVTAGYCGRPRRTAAGPLLDPPPPASPIASQP